MKGLIEQDQSMTASQLLLLVNEARLLNDETAVRRNDFIARCQDELLGDHYESFVVTNPNGTKSLEINMNRDQCMFVLMRESKRVRRKVNEMLKEVKPDPQFFIPSTLSEALRLAADQAEQIERQQLVIEQQKPAVEFVQHYVQCDGPLGFRQVCKLLKANEREFKGMLEDKGIMYELGGRMTPKACHLDAGRFEIFAGTSKVNDKAFIQPKFTPKGVQWIAGIWAAHQLERGDV